MQNRASTINLFVGTCMYVCAYIIPVMHSGVGPSMCSFMTTKLNSLKCSLLRNLMPLLHVLRKPPTSILKTTYVDV